jgi:hypothetical protein
MAHSAPQEQPTDASSDIFARCGLPSVAARARCDGFAARTFPVARILTAPIQGFCSYTLLIGADAVLQFRPPQYRLDVPLARQARLVYGNLAPDIEFLGRLDPGSGPDDAGSVGMAEADDGTPIRSARSWWVYRLTRMPGVPLSGALGPGAAARQEPLLRSFAHFYAQGWRHAVSRLCSPLPKGKVGSSLGMRLRMLRSDLPGRFRPVVSAVLQRLPSIEALPWVLTHGDLVPSNIIVEPVGSEPKAAGEITVTPKLCGFIDWAEAEYLPFGVGLYGLEELLGVSVVARNDTKQALLGKYPPPGSRFVYFNHERMLRQVFWAELHKTVPELELNGQLREAVGWARLLGILLWHGIAFDSGRLDRVVQVGRDDEEVQRLDLFLLGIGKSVDDRSRHNVSSSPLQGGED